MKISEEELNKILKLHRQWLEGNGGERAVLEWEDLHEANLRKARLRKANLCRADLIYANLCGADLQEASLHKADFSDANLCDADLHRANICGAVLIGADLDFSCWPLWRGSLGVIVDKRIAAQLAYHFCSVICDDPEFIEARNAILDFANQFHRVEECGRLERIEGRREDIPADQEEE